MAHSQGQKGTQGRRLQVYRPEGSGTEQVNQAKAGALNATTLVILAVAALGVGYGAYLLLASVIHGIVVLMGTISLVVIGLVSGLFAIKPRRIITPEELAAGTTYLEAIAARGKKDLATFSDDTSSFDTQTPEQKAKAFEQIHNGFLFEFCFNLFALVVVGLHGVSGVNKVFGVNLICFFASMALLVHTIKYGVIYGSWPMTSKKPAETEAYGPWLASRIKYTVIGLYVLAFLAIKFGVL